MTQSDTLRNLKITQLTSMQEAVYSAFQEDHDLIVISPTGTGKSVAFLLPLLQLLNPQLPDVQAVVLVPSRELALQIETVFRKMSHSFRAMSCYGGHPTAEEHRTLRGIHPHLIIATPGRMNDHLVKKNIEGHRVGTLIIDEFDKCLELGFQKEMSEVIAQLPALKKRVLLSATDSVEIPTFVGLKAGYKKLNFSDSTQISSRLELQQVLSPQKDKLETLYRLLCTLGEKTSLVFVNYRESVDRVANYLKSKNFPCDAYHGGLEQQVRERALYKFRNGSCPVLISTDLASRGLDIPGIDNVVHYHLPVSEESFIHRNGRTARWKASGFSFLLLHEEESLPPYLPSGIPLYNLPEQTPKPPKPCWATLYIGKGKKEKLSKVDIVGFLCKRGGLTGEEIGTVDVREHAAFVAIRRNRLNQLLTLIRGEKIKGIKTVVEEAK